MEAGDRTPPAPDDVLVTSDDVVIVTDDVVLEDDVVDVDEVFATAEGVAVPHGCTVVAPDDVTGLLARWRSTRTTFAVVDERGRHAGTLQPGRLDLTRPAALDARWIGATLRRTGWVHLDAGNVPRAAKPAVVRRALAVVAELRAGGGGPECVLVEDAQDVLRHPGVPPHGMRLTDAAFHFAMR